MSEALERVIAEQQKRLDDLQKLNESYCRSLDTVFTKHNKLFEQIARFIEANEKDQHKHRMEVRIEMIEAGWCFGCYSFVCECDHD